MAWDFETDPAFQLELDWIDRFTREEIEPLDHLLGNHYDLKDPRFIRFVRPLQRQVRERGLWACHLGPELGGQGYGQVKLALMNEIIGRTRFGPIVFGAQAPDSGNAEILARYGTLAQRERYLQPLLDNEIVSCFCLTEPHGGADPVMIRTTATTDAVGWRLAGEKWFATNARYADFLIIMAVTDPDAPPHKRASMFLVPRDTPGIEIVRNVGYGQTEATHAYLRLTDVRVPADAMLGGRGDGFVVAQTRLGGGRIHHAMRTIAKAREAFDRMCERALSRTTKGERLADKQMVQEKIADSWVEFEQFRLLVLRTAWKIDKLQDYKQVRKDIAAVKFATPKLLHDIAGRALHLHGSLGLSDEMPFMHWVTESYFLALADGPTEVHKVTVAKQVLRDYRPSEDLFPAYHLPRVRAAALDRYGADLDELEPAS
ncbi:acyl-CoA dehydrogenase family protein [Sphingobium naphthae]|uniref:Acyl-CoA dehydrogenase family protein n=1 Tax=Sphingobium naphthae TaxID=1886786 RepID=A0ABU4A1N2_9SPHN|nr:acyl-CoA dehydrogenase family protein [Sphingobium naphthae]MCC4250855.1 acyl-CoA dehydrogenase family protein [Sphingobium naphthae]MDV5825497.1 acyl-CoA dehydrogenase family protein [Sphingobium naphthae]|tara:strand:- start:798 stop:2087 length:1290 start_codon:yes stop_codon:yes gene_type:complete